MPYDLRYAAPSPWLSAGGFPERRQAGNSDLVLLTFSKHCIHGYDDHLK